MGITLKQLNQFAKSAGVSDNVEILTMGSDVRFMVATKDFISEEILLDDTRLNAKDFKYTEVLRVWEDGEGEEPGFRCCANCGHCWEPGTRNSDTGYCQHREIEVDLYDEDETWSCKFQWKEEM